MTSKQKQYCMNVLTSLVVEILLEDSKKKDESQIIYEFTSSKTYSLLQDPDTGLWKEGPDYLICLYKKELA